MKALKKNYLKVKMGKKFPPAQPTRDEYTFLCWFKVWAYYAVVF